MRIRPAAAHLFVGADAHIGPTECTIFTKIFGEFAASQRADVGIGPYKSCSAAFPLPRKARQGELFLLLYRCSCTYRFTRLWIMLAVV